MKSDSTLAIRPTEEPILSREVVLVTTHDRLEIPPIRRFRELVQEIVAVPRLFQSVSNDLLGFR